LIVNKQIEESIKGVKNIEYHSQFAVPPSSTAPTYVAGSSADLMFSTALAGKLRINGLEVKMHDIEMVIV
jgi:hypothetical protein